MLVLELEGRLDVTLPVRPLVPAVGLLVVVVVGLLLTVGLAVVPELLPVVRFVVVAPTVGRLLMLPLTLPVVVPSLFVRPDMLPPVWLRRPLLGMLWLIEPLVLLGCLTLAT